MTCGIYKIALDDGRCYVGQSVDIEDRWREHRRHLRADKHHARYLQNAWNKYGEAAFTFSTLDECSRELLTEREQHWIDTQNSVFNVCRAAKSSLGYKHTAEAIEKIRQYAQNQYPEARAKISEALRHRPVSQERRDKLAEANRVRVWTPEQRYKVASIRRGQPLSPEHCAKLSASRLGKKRGPYAKKIKVV